MNNEYILQLKNDLIQYLLNEIDINRINLDFNNACGEGHCYHSDNKVIFETQSDVKIIFEGEEIGNGWFEYIEDIEDNEIYLFWQFLSGKGVKRKRDCTIPTHIWDKLSNKSKEILKTRRYNSTDIKNYELRIKNETI